MKQEKLLELASKYDFKNIKTRIESLDGAIVLNIGVLGEFSSGKSTLINAMLGKKVLPSMETPTTGSITELEPRSDIQSQKYFRRTDAGLETISASEFSDIALGKEKGTVVLQVPENGMLKEGFKVIDTPGLESLNQTHADITFGYLPFLDGAIICQDINKGGLTQSILKFIKSPEVRPYLNRFLFVVTRADQKSEHAVQEVCHHIQQSLNEQVGDLCDDLSERVIPVSALKVLNDHDASSFEAYQTAFQTCFFDKKRVIVSERIEKECHKIGSDLLILMHDKDANTSLSSHELKAKEASLQEEIQAIKSAQDKEGNRLNKLRKNIENGINQIAPTYASRYETASEEDTAAMTSELVATVGEMVQNKINACIEGFTMPQISHLGKGLEDMVAQVNKNKEIGVTIVTSAIMAGLSIGTSLMANAGETVVAATARTIAKETVKKAAKGVTVKVAKKIIINKCLIGTAKLIEEINPLTHVGEYAARKVKKNNASQILDKLSYQISEQTYLALQEYFDDQVFTPLVEQYEDLQHSLKQLYQEQEQSTEKQRSLRKSLKEDIITLQAELS